jgi:hypothetical protein
MRTPTLEDIRRHPELRQQLVQAAHRQRNEEVSRLFARLVQALKPRPVAPRSLATGRG